MPEISRRNLPVSDAQRINLAWLSRLRWGATCGQLAAVLFADLGVGLQLPLRELLAVILIEVMFNIAVTLRLRSARLVSETSVMLTMAVDILVLTALLYFSGGPFNPFHFLYLVHIAMAAVLVGTPRSWGLVLLALACSAFLFVDHVRLDLSTITEAGGEWTLAAGTWVALVVSAGFIVYFVTQVTVALANRENELRDVQERSRRQEKLAALATLSAGAAHELGTPLSTIALVAKELERSLLKSMGEGDAVEDARLIRGEVTRCRNILDSMAADAGQATGEGPVITAIADLFEQTLDGLKTRHRVQVELPDGVAQQETKLYPQALSQALRNVVKNAIEATPPPEPVHLSAEREGASLRITVRDRGTGMDPIVLERAGQPFYTTKPAGKGMGLGLFLARAVVERAGGTFELDSQLGTGTTARLTIPIRD